jgi:transposase InsO family protein
MPLSASRDTTPSEEPTGFRGFVGFVDRRTVCRHLHVIGNQTVLTSFGSPILRISGCENRSSTWQSFYDNALAESFMRTLKHEEVYLHSYRDRDDALLHIQDFLERIYNCERLHSTLGYLAPVAYEAAAKDKGAEASA